MTLFTGKATYYELDLSLTTACGRSYSSTDVIVAVSTEHWANGSNTNNDPICDKAISVSEPNSPGFSLTVLIEDRCGSCGTGDLDFSKPAFEKFHSADVGTFKVEWEFVSRTTGK